MLAFICLVAIDNIAAQARKLPEISFQNQSVEYADANRSYNQANHYVDTLRDEEILKQLVGILIKNSDLIIEISGHVAINEPTDLGLKRAEKVKQFLLENDIDTDRIVTRNEAHDRPIITDDILFSLPTKEEKEAANQKNRRVEIKVVGLKEE